MKLNSFTVQCLGIVRFCPFLLILVMLFACGGNSDTKTEKRLEDHSDRISKIEITAFGKTTTLSMKYEKDAVNIEFQPYQGNVESRVEWNDRKQIREVISGPSRIQYLYDDNGRQMGVFVDNGLQQIMFDYEENDIVAQHSIRGNDTVVSFFYSYSDGLPSEVEIKDKSTYYRKYQLEYSEIDNSLTGFNELILPIEISGLLGIPATYGEKFLKKATRIDSGAAVDPQLQEGYTPKLDAVEFEISKSGKQETLKLVSDGTRQWSAAIHW